MYTQTHAHKRTDGNGQMILEPLEKKGRTVRLLGQNGGKVTILEAGEDEPETVESHVFFATHREAYPVEVAAYEKKAEPKAAREPAPAK